MRIPLLLLANLVLATCQQYALVKTHGDSGLKQYYIALSSAFSPLDHEVNGTLVKAAPVLACPPNYTDPDAWKAFDLANAAALNGNIALIGQGNCTFVTKVHLAQKAGAKAVVVFSKGDTILTMGPTTASGLSIPAVMVSHQAGMSFSQLSHVPVVLSPYKPSRFDASSLVLMFVAIGTVVAGAYWSADKVDDGSTPDSSQSSQQQSEEIVVINERAAYCFVVVASVGLLTLFYFIDNLIYFLIVMFTIAGCQSLYGFLARVTRKWTPRSMLDTVELPCFGAVSYWDLLLSVLSIITAVTWAFRRNDENAWIAQDLMSLTLLLMIQRTVRLPNIKISCILLVLAFLYDIFWVFISPYVFQKSVMITVATGGDTGEAVPMLLKMPHFNSTPLGRNYSLLGLGDIALPGLFVSFTFRFDQQHRLSGFREGYFAIASVGYAIGIAITNIVLMATLSGQPALLYLVPCTLGVVSLVAWRRGDLSAMWGNGARNKRGRLYHEHLPLHEDEDEEMGLARMEDHFSLGLGDGSDDDGL